MDIREKRIIKNLLKQLKENNLLKEGRRYRDTSKGNWSTLEFFIFNFEGEDYEIPVKVGAWTEEDSDGKSGGRIEDIQFGNLPDELDDAIFEKRLTKAQIEKALQPDIDNYFDELKYSDDNEEDALPRR